MESKGIVPFESNLCTSGYIQVRGKIIPTDLFSAFTYFLCLNSYCDI